MPLDTWKYRELARRVASLEDSAKAAAAKPAEKASPGKGFWDVVQLLMPIVNAAAIGLVGWWISGAVEAGLKRDQLQLAQAKEMQQLIASLTSQKIDDESALPAALTLAAYGKPAVPPLLAVLTERFDEVRGPAVESALRAVGMTNREALCGPLIALSKARSGRLGWPIQATVIRLLGDVQCSDATPQLRALDQRLATRDLKELQADFASQPTFDKSSIVELRQALAASLRTLEPAP